MYRIFTILLLAIVSNISWAQESEQTKPQNEQAQQQPTAGQIFTSHYAYTYQAALRYNDYTVAKEALYNMLVENPKNDSILFRLSALYFQMQKYASAALTSSDLISRNPDNVAALEINANALETLGATDKALDSYESLYLKTDDVQVLYKIAFLQYDMKRYAESLTNVDILLKDEKINELTAVFNTSDNQQKEYPLKVALVNLKGMIFMEQGDKVKAKEYFNQALQLAPDFELAKQNLAELNK